MALDTEKNRHLRSLPTAQFERVHCTVYFVKKLNTTVHAREGGQGAACCGKEESGATLLCKTTRQPVDLAEEAPLNKRAPERDEAEEGRRGRFPARVRFQFTLPRAPAALIHHQAAFATATPGTSVRPNAFVEATPVLSSNRRKQRLGRSRI